MENRKLKDSELEMATGGDGGRSVGKKYCTKCKTNTEHYERSGGRIVCGKCGQSFRKMPPFEEWHCILKAVCCTIYEGITHDT